MEEFVNHMFSAPRNVLSKVHVDTASSGPGEGGKACYPVELELPVSHDDLWETYPTNGVVHSPQWTSWFLVGNIIVSGNTQRHHPKILHEA